MCTIGSCVPIQLVSASRAKASSLPRARFVEHLPARTASSRRSHINTRHIGTLATLPHIHRFPQTIATSERHS